MRAGRIRLIVFAIGVVAAGLLSAPVSASASAAPSPWLQTEYNAAHSNANVAESGVGASNIASLRSAFTITAPPADCGVCSTGLSVLAISQNRLYAVVNDDLTAFDLTTGRRLWRTAVTFDEVYSTIAVTHGYVIVGGNDAGTSDPNSYVGVFDAATGAFVRTLRNPDVDALHGLEVFGKYVVAQYGCSECGGDGRTVAYRLSNFSVAWQTPIERALQNVATGDVVVDGQTFEITQDAGTYTLHSYLAYNGAARWRRAGVDAVLAGDTDAATAHTLIAESGDSVLDLDPRTGATRFALVGATTNQPLVAVDASRIYASCSPAHDVVCAYSTRDGTLLWKRTDPSGTYGVRLSVANGLVYLDSGVVLSASTGAVVTTLSTHPALVGSGRVGAFVGGVYDRDRFTVLAPTG